MQIQVVRCSRKTLSLKVNAAGEVVVRAPRSVSESQIEAFVSRHTVWISRRLAELGGPLRLDDGAELSLFGRPYKIITGKRAALGGDMLALPEKDREQALVRLLKRMAKARMGELTETLARTHGFSYASVAIGSARTRWGSCNARGAVCYSFRICFLPDDLAEYLAVHELCHTRHLDHSAAFWSEVGRILPDYAARRSRLKGYRWVMNCL